MRAKGCLPALDILDYECYKLLEHIALELGGSARLLSTSFYQGYSL